MKIILLSLFCLLAVTCSYAQKWELSFGANSGLFHYSGSAATSTSYINEGETPKENYTYKPYGNKGGFSYGGDIKAQYVTKGGFIAGLSAGYDVLRSKVNLNGVQPLIFYLYTDVQGPYYYNTEIPAKGQTYLQDQSINLSPYIGYRIKTKKIKIDLMPGIDVAFDVNSYDKGRAADSAGTVYKTDYKLLNAPTDVRLKFGAAASYKKWAVTASFAHGLVNLYKNTMSESGFIAHSELFRFGISYRIL